jgi:hypothetical protein
MSSKTPLNSAATFDCLFVARRLQQQNGSFSIPELHIFGYLACLLWLYRNQPITDWGYTFVGTELGAPFSQDIDTAANEFLEHGLFHRTHERLRMTELAERKLQIYEQLNLNFERVEYLQAACASISAFSVGMVCTALANEPELKRSNAIPASRQLLEELARSQLYLQFSALHKAFSGRSNDLRLPAVTWLTALYSSGISESAVT